MEKGLELAGQPVKRGTMAHEHDTYTLLADAAGQERHLDALRQYAARAEELAAQDSHTLYLAIANRAAGVQARLVGDVAGAEGRLNTALDLFGTVGARWQVGRTLVELGELAAADANPGTARGYFARALDAFEALAARPDAERVQAALNALEG